MTTITEVKQPNFLMMKRVWIAVALPLVIFYFLGTKGLIDLALIWIFVSILLLMFAYKKFKVRKWNANTKDNFNEKNNGIWSHEYFSSLMIIDTNKRKIFLKEEDKQKTYDFSEVREWRYNLSHGGEIVGGGLSSLTLNKINTNKNLYESGFFVTVNDIHNPEWHIHFFPRKGHINTQDGVRDLELQFKRWMQVFDQVINK
ncbi:DUF4755 domain-containing protein [Erwinia mallotivora]|uniref:DUF4755 domain-containing protein n=1 Tax=Erwinia mallotivora TaxID=69222 RepID=UPI0021BFA40C|nr:DUF4755 domain-containing protein [Erwinia mallotivora]